MEKNIKNDVLNRVSKFLAEEELPLYEFLYKSSTNLEYFAWHGFRKTFTAQQLEAGELQDKLIICKCKVWYYGNNREKYKEFYGDAPPTEEEVDIGLKVGISIMSGQGPGKTFFAALSALRFICCFTSSLVPCTAPTADQLKLVFFKQIGLLLDTVDPETGEKIFPLSDEIVKDSVHVYVKKYNKTKNFIVARTAKVNPNGESETLQGMHDDYMMIIADEASGVHNAIFKPLEGTATGMCNIFLLIFNPTKANGFAYDTHYGKSKNQWLRLHWDCRMCEKIDKAHIDRIRDKWGEDSNFFRIRIKGLPPVSTPDSLIPHEWAVFADERQQHEESRIVVTEEAPIVIGIDVARMGKNKSVIVVRHGPIIIDIRPFSKLKTVELEAEIIKCLTDYPDYAAVIIDSNGIGGAMYDLIKNRYKFNIYGLNSREASSQPEKFSQVKDELWWDVRTCFENGTVAMAEYLKPHLKEFLIAELSDIRYNSNLYASRGVVKIETKEEMRDRGVLSPDFGDAYMLTMYKKDANLIIRPNKYQDRYEKAFDKESYASEEPEDWKYEYLR